MPTWVTISPPGNRSGPVVAAMISRRALLRGLVTAGVVVIAGVGSAGYAFPIEPRWLPPAFNSKLPHLLSLSRRAIRAIRQNLVFSLGVLAAAAGLTIPGILTPVTGALLHELSSIPVIMNSARLIRAREAN